MFGKFGESLVCLVCLVNLQYVYFIKVVFLLSMQDGEPTPSPLMVGSLWN